MTTHSGPSGTVGTDKAKDTNGFSFAIPAQSGPMAHGPLSHRSTGMEAEQEDKQSTILRLREMLKNADNKRQTSMDLKTELVVLYTQAVERVPDDVSREMNLAQLKVDLDNQMAPVEAEIQRAEQHFQLIKSTLEAKVAMIKERRMLEDAQSASRLATPATSEGSDSTVLDVVPVETNRKHVSLARVFNYKRIPVIDMENMEIDYNRVQLKEKVGAPVFELELEGISEAETALEAVKGTIIQPTYGDKSWKQVQRCLAKMLKFDLMRAKILGQLFNAVPKHGEDANSFADRLDVLIEAAGVENMGEPLLATITAALPDAGREKVLAEFKSLDYIPSVKDLLAFIRTNPSVMTGRATDPRAWLVGKFVKKDKRTTDPMAIHKPYNEVSQTTTKRAEITNPHRIKSPRFTTRKDRLQIHANTPYAKASNESTEMLDALDTTIQKRLKELTERHWPKKAKMVQQKRDHKLQH
ncbi:hypothetical protein BGZ65_010984 [Modicella reniformis]|uniref:Uncharacterized protein n=1 Tax=Modicella reniformis TaxID=1440133 RepID=A0A9P6SNT3_9FUNG|nr:hypothetical protein BGZ65_010984 [Modicella reniformis]